MGRPGSKSATEAELLVLKVLWQKGPCTLRQIWEHLPPGVSRASVHVRLRSMLDKGLLTLRRRPRWEGGAVYSAGKSRVAVSVPMLRRLAGLFGGSPQLLIQGLLRGGQLDEKELRELRELLKDHRERGKP